LAGDSGAGGVGTLLGPRTGAVLGPWSGKSSACRSKKESGAAAGSAGCHSRDKLPPSDDRPVVAGEATANAMFRGGLVSPRAGNNIVTPMNAISVTAASATAPTTNLAGENGPCSDSEFMKGYTTFPQA
jgi:hypothetical protein